MWALVLVDVCVMKRLPLADVSSNGSIWVQELKSLPLLVLAFHTSSAKHVDTIVTSPRCFSNCLLEIVEPSWVEFIQGLFPLIVPDDN